MKGFDSICIRDDHSVELNRTHGLPLHLSTSFDVGSVENSIEIFKKQKSGYVYSRYNNPTLENVARKIAMLEAYESNIESFALITSSGMSAISTLILSLCQKGDTVLTQGNLYGGTTELFMKVLEPQGIKFKFVDLENHELIEEILQEDKTIRLLYFETPTNPTLTCLDIEKLTSLARKYDLRTAIDNTFCTPYLQRPLQWGVDFSIHSTTKYMNGHGSGTAGAIVGVELEDKEKIWQTMKLLGTTGNPFDAWLINNGLKTLTLRMKAHSENALRLANFLETHEQVIKVNYPGLPSSPSHNIAKKQMKAFGGMLSFEIKGGMHKAMSFINQLKFCSHAPTLGDVDTLVLHPATSSHLNVPSEMREQNQITDGLIRISVGIESFEDIKTDVKQALES